MQPKFETVKEACELIEDANEQFAQSSAFLQTSSETLEYVCTLLDAIAGLVQLHTIEQKKKLFQKGNNA